MATVDTINSISNTASPPITPPAIMPGSKDSGSNSEVNYQCHQCIHNIIASSEIPHHVGTKLNA